MIFSDNKSSSTISCSSGKVFNIDNNPQSIEEFNQCNSVITGSVQNPNLKCADNGILIYIGFQLSAGRGFVNLIDVCYNKRTGSAIYTKHVIPGKAIKGAMKSNTRPGSFKATEVPSKFNPAKSFTKASQLRRLQEIFGADRAKELLDQTYLARGHLAPDGDFIFVSWQYTTYYYINTVPQWQSINNANWKHVESILRLKANKLKSDLKIFTGGFGVLSLEGKRITLESDGIEVPEWTWKIAQDSASDSGIAFVTYNNPFATQAPEPLCTDVCNENDWDWKERRTLTKGFTICCKVLDFINAVPTVPREAKSSKVLKK